MFSYIFINGIFPILQSGSLAEDY